MEKIAILCAAVMLDWIFGDPAKIPHPISLIGSGIRFIEKRLRKKEISLKTAGFLLLVLTTGSVTLVITLILYVAGLIHPVVKLLVTVYLLYTSLAAKCMRVEAMKVHSALATKKLSEARRFVSYLVGRDTNALDEMGVTLATVETTAENTIDGVLAPLLFIVLGLFFNLPVQSVFLYKTVNTLDSMVGYIQEPYREIGYFSAKADDLFNYVPARIGSICMLFGGGFGRNSFKEGLRILKRDRRNHKSPNCAYPESVVAGLLGIQMGGTHTYFNEILVKPTIGDATRQVQLNDIQGAIRIMYGGQIVLLTLCILLLSLSWKL